MTWHIRLIQAREAAGLSKTKLAELVGVSVQAVSQWESGQVASVSADSLLAICDALDVPPVWLLRGTGPTPPLLNPTGESGKAPDSLGERIKVARLAIGMSQGDLSTFLGKAQSAVSRWEQNLSAPEFDALVPLAQVLRVSLDWLLGVDAAPLADVRASLVKRSGMQVVSQLTSALVSGQISEPRLNVLAALIQEFATAD